MTALAIASQTVKELTTRLEAKQIVIETAATAVSADTLAVTLANYGITTFTGIVGLVHTTANSVLVAEAPTTSVTSGVLTITVGGSAVTKKRTYIIYGY